MGGLMRCTWFICAAKKGCSRGDGAAGGETGIEEGFIEEPGAAGD
jgi:hypothetical protein